MWATAITMVDLGQLASELDALERDSALHEDRNLGLRAEAIEFTDFVQDLVRLLGEDGADQETLDTLAERAATLKRCLQEIDARLIERVRVDLVAGRYTKQSLRAELDRYTAYTPRQPGLAHYDYDALDVLIGGLMRPVSAPSVSEPRDPEMIHLEPTPARAILELTDRVPFGPGDVFYDLGSGLGRVVILVHLLTGVTAKGVEVDPAYYAHAVRRAKEFGLTNVSFIHADARDANYADGTVFYLFSPFKGQMLQQVLSRLQRVAASRPKRARPVRVCTYGPCTPIVAEQPWLTSADGNADHEFKLALFRSA